MNDERTHKFREKNSMLVREFDRYVLEHPEFTDRLPDNALLIMQIAGDEDFNTWARHMGPMCAEQEQPIVYVMIREMKPVRSRIESVDLELVA